MKLKNIKTTACYIILAVSFSFCSSKQKDEFYLASKLLESIEKNDSTIFKNEFLADSSFSKFNFTKDWKSLIEIDGKNKFELIEMDTITRKMSYEFLINNEVITKYIYSKNLEIFLKSGKRYYEISMNNEFDSLSNPIFNGLWFTDINAECNRKKEKSYVGDRVRCEKVSYSLNKTGFNELKIEVNNISDIKLTKIQAQVKVYFENEKAFSKTFEIYKNIYPKDLIQVPVPSINDAFIGNGLNRNNFKVKVDILDVSFP